MSRARWALVVPILLTSCGGNSSPTAPASVPAGPPPTATPATPAPAPTPTIPVPTPKPNLRNHAPSVQITTGEGQCHPTLNRQQEVLPCQVTFEAVASDPDGDRLKYSWTGCPGKGPKAACTISRPGPVNLGVTVSDGRGGVAEATAVARGTNRPPRTEPLVCFYYAYLNPTAPCGADYCDPPLPAHGIGTCWWYGDWRDPDGDAWYCAGVRGHGACAGSFGTGMCGGLAGTVEADFRTRDPGNCTLTLTIEDAWGARSTSTTTVPVGP